MIGIYKIKSPSNRVYIGQSINIETRFKCYQKINCKGQVRLYESLKKYGFENHVFEVIEECSIDLLNERERYYQDKYNVISKKGLNCRLTKTNDKSGKHSEISKIKMSISKKGRKHSDESKKKMSISKSNMTKETKLKLSKANKGYKHTYEAKIKIANANRNRSKETRLKLSILKSKKVLDTQSGIFYNSAKETASCFGINHFTLMCKLSGHRNNNTQFIYI